MRCIINDKSTMTDGDIAVKIRHLLPAHSFFFFFNNSDFCIKASLLLASSHQPPISSLVNTFAKQSEPGCCLDCLAIDLPLAWEYHLAEDKQL